MASSAPCGAVKTMAMAGSSSEESYAQHSSFQNQNFHRVAKPILAKAVAQLLCNVAARTPDSAQGRKHITIADLGCSYGRNTLDCAEFILDALQRNWAFLQDADKMPEIQYFFSDLPSNDFNALFQSLDPYFHHTSHGSSYTSAASHVAADINLPRVYVAGVPGSFHGRLFTSASLDLVICSYSLHWLSQVPPSVIDKASLAWNGGHIWITQSSQNVLDAYALQSQIDVVNFLKSRTQEIASGGILFLFHMARSNILKNERPSNYGTPMDLFEWSWKEMVNEGIITMDELDMFNMPMYLFNERELDVMLKDVPEFKIVHMETIENIPSEEESFPLYKCLEVITSATKPTVETHLGEKKSKELYRKLKVIGTKQNVFLPILPHNLLVACLQKL